MNPRIFISLMCAAVLVAVIGYFVLRPSAVPEPAETSLEPSISGVVPDSHGPEVQSDAPMQSQIGEQTVRPGAAETVAHTAATVDEANRRSAENRKSALAWAVEQGQFTRHAVRAVLDPWIEEDPRGAFEAARWIVDRDDPNLRTFALSQVVGTWSRFEPESAAAAIWTLPPSLNTEMLKSQVFGHWAEQDPAAAAAALQSRSTTASGDTSKSTSQSIFANVGSLYALQDNERARKWAMEFPEDSPERTYAIAGVVAGWTQQDIEAPIDWLQRMPPGAARDAGTSTLVQRAIPIDPEGAVQWAQTISDANTRSQLTSFAAAHWLITNPAKAKDWIKEADVLTPDQRKKILDSNRAIQNAERAISETSR